MASAAPLTAESYHLKWDSHSMNINLSLATLYKHDRFADVMLLSSHPECLGGPGVPAHKIILSASSKFFASIFELTPYIPSQNGLMHLVLPPELSRRAIQVLVQYMYSGESTVSNDILNEVLKGGEILKIRGLYTGNSGGLNKYLNLTSSIGNANILSNMNHSTSQTNSPSSLTSKNSEKNDLKTKQSSKEVVQHTTKSHPGAIPQKQFNLKINKDIAIDPDFSRNIALFTSRNIFQCTKNNQNLESQSLLSVNTDYIPQDRIERRKSSVESDFSDCLLQIKDEPNDSCSEKSLNHQISYNSDNAEIIDNNYLSSENSVMEENENEIDECDIKLQKSTSESDEISVSLFSDYCDEKPIFVENITNNTELQENQESIHYVQKKKRKMETESITEKKKSTTDGDVEISILKCEICHIVFKLPAEWVRHMQQYHTETELAISNELANSNEKLQKCKVKSTRVNKTTQEFMNKLTKVCNYCQKSFPSYKEKVSHVRKEHHPTNKTDFN